MKYLLTFSLCWWAMGAVAAANTQTVRGEAQYLSTDAAAVADTCPGNDIIHRFTCPKDAPAAMSCFDVYRVQGDPIDKDRYTLLDQTLTTQDTTAQPECNFSGELSCGNFLQSLKYNLDFSWFIANFPSSSFAQCGQTYTCTRIVCWKALQNTDYGAPQAQKLSCVFKKNQIYFLGAQVTCQSKTAAK